MDEPKYNEEHDHEIFEQGLNNLSGFPIGPTSQRTSDQHGDIRRDIGEELQIFGLKLQELCIEGVKKITSVFR